MPFPKLAPRLGASLLFAFASALAALPPPDASDAVKAIEREEEQKQPWVMPTKTGESVGAFLAQLRKEAESGDVKSQATLGYYYAHGLGVKMDLAAARTWYEKAAAHGHAEAKAELAGLYDTGLGGPADKEKALRLATEAAGQGSAWAEYQLGQHFAHGTGVAQSWAEAAKWYAKAAAQKQTSACINLGVLYFNGTGVAQNLAEAERLFRIAAEAGSPMGEFDLANLLSLGTRKSEAADWYRKAALIGYAPAELSWSKCLFNGTGVTADWKDSLKWAQKAARGGNINAGLQAAKIVLNRPVSDEAAKKEAIEWARTAAEQGSPSGGFYLARALFDGIGLEKDEQGAIAEFRRAAELGSVDAQLFLGTIAERGMGVPRDYQEAARWYKQAAAAGNATAEYRYGLFLRDGSGVEMNLGQAVLWLEKAVQADPTKPLWKADLEDARRLRARAPQIQAESEFKTAISLRHLALTGKPELMAEAVQHLQKASDAGMPIAKAFLAWNYRRGQGVTRDDAKAETLISELEGTTDPEVLLRMAFSYFLDERLIDPDYVWRAHEYFRRAAERGDSRGQNSLGYMLMSSNVIPRDYVEACKWLTLSARVGDKNAQINLDRVKLMLSAKEIAEAERRAAEFQPAKGS